MRKLKNIIFLTSIFIITAAFNFQHNPPSGWYQQFPNTNGATIMDMVFTDSLNGFIVTSIGGSDSYILKTTNGGDNWVTKFMHTDPFVKLKFINSTTGFTNAFNIIFKTTNSGENWNQINLPGIFGDDMFVLSQDTIWLAMSESLTGGVYRTTNGGVNWVRQLSLGSQNPTKIYFYNKNLGFITNPSGNYVRRTTDAGVTWSIVVSNQGFNDIHFLDSLNGWRSYATSMKKTTDGGIIWVDQPLPQGGYISSSDILKFSVLNKDTIWGVGAYLQYPNLQSRGMIYTTTNGGNNWLYQVPDTAINIFRYYHVQFTDKSRGWAYTTNRGIHTKVGGDPLTSITQTNTQIPSQYILGQNYPNPFNPSTSINYEVKSAGFISIKVFDLQGREIALLLDQKQNIGSYTVSFDASKYYISSGIYFYSMYADGSIIDTRKMMLVK